MEYRRRVGRGKARVSCGRRVPQVNFDAVRSEVEDSSVLALLGESEGACFPRPRPALSGTQRSARGVVSMNSYAELNIRK